MRRFLRNLITALFKPAQLFRALNFKIIIYFISFGFLPLLVFSFLGYYLNKDLITHINRDNLNKVNSSYAKEIEVFLQYKYRILATVFSEAGERYSEATLNILRNEFSAVVRDFNGSTDTVYFVKDSLTTPYISFYSDEHTIYKGYLELSELQSLIVSDVLEYEHFILVPGINLKISPVDTSGIAIGTKIFDFNTGTSQNYEAHLEKSDTFKSYTNLDEFGYTVMTTIDAGSFYAELNDFRDKILLGNAVLAMLVLILSIVYSKQITTPIHKLIDAIQHIGRGNLEKRIEIQTNDEIQILANEFEIMRQKLFESYQGMEEKIQARTQQLQEAQAQISHQEKMASLGLMAAGIAHEIGNPLTSISSLSQVIKRKTNDERILEHLNNILKGIERISRIVRELVDFSKPSAYKAAHTNINEIINSAVGIIKYDRRSKHITYLLELDQSLPKTILVSDHLLQVLLNILINAVDASEGFGNIIKVITYSQNGSIHIDIEDEGCGIPEDKLNKIFEPFYTTKEVGKGTGLGLTVSYGLIKKMNGEIKVKSKLKKGSIFTVILPVREEIED